MPCRVGSIAIGLFLLEGAALHLRNLAPGVRVQRISMFRNERSGPETNTESEG
jgi:hypothetical protein